MKLGWDQYFGYGLIDLSNFEELISNSGNTDIIDFEVDETTAINASFGNITNLMNLEITLKDINGNEYIKTLADLEDLEIENYDPFASGSQEIIIKYNGIEKEVTITHTFTGDTSAYLCHYVDEDAQTVSVTIDAHEIPKKIYVLDYVHEYKVVGIDEDCFKNKDIKEVILPSSVTTIGDNAFYNSTIEKLSGGADEIIIGNNSFNNAYKLKSIDSIILSLGDYAFYNATSLSNVKLSDNITIIPIYTFFNCANLNNFKLPENITEIKEYAFAGAGIKDLVIPKTLTTISLSSFLGMINLETISVDSENTVFDSRNNCNSLIETGTNTLILGSSNSSIPSRVETIANYAFYNNQKLEHFNTKNVKIIGEYAFYGCKNLIDIYLGESLETLGYCALRDLPKVAVYTYNQDLLTELMNEHWVEQALCVIPKEIIVSSNETYKAFEKLENIEINLKYYGFGFNEFLSETINDGYEIKYSNGGDCFKYGDKYFNILATTKHGIDINEKISVTIEKAIPEYVVPSNIEAELGQTLSQIVLPEGFYWMNENEIIDTNGTVIYMAKFVPNDTYNYKTIENIEIKVNVISKCTSIYSSQDSYTLTANTDIYELNIYALPEEATNKELTFEIEDTTIAKIESGKIKVLKDGTTNLIVKTTDGTDITKTITLTIDKTIPFVDIKETDWCYGAVRFVYKNGYIVGTTETTYEPGKKLTRGMIVTILNRMEGNNKPDVECKFSDVHKGEYYYNSVKWATEAGIVHGYEDGKFRPNKAITREELAVILRNYTRYKRVDTNLTADLSGFNDGDTVSSFAQKSVEWAVARGVITGYTHNNTIAPQGTATRDVAASVIYKYFKTAN